jgi:electron transfer flavoprotein alpha subunit
MAKTLIVGEIQGGALREATLEVVSLARKLGDVVSLVIGSGVQSVAEDLSKKGGGKVLVAEDAALENYTVDAYSQVIRQAVEAESPDLVLISHTPAGWDLAPKLAAQLDAPIISDVFNIEEQDGGLVFFKRVFNGKFDGQFRLVGAPCVATVQPGATGAYEGTEAGSVEALAVSGIESRTKFIETRKAEAGGLDLSKADIIVSGGRGLQKQENFDEVLKPFAEALGAGMGASRPVVDAGWLPYEHQIGSSGQVVTPKLYFAIGISGAIQHLVGMKGANYIVAINKDADAPIFEAADVGIVGDLFEILPALTSAVSTAKGG